MPYNDEKYDVIIVGSGPAGSILGYELSRRGAKVLIIEKYKLPRYKTCGGGLTRKTLCILPFDVSDVIEDYTYIANITFDSTNIFSKTYIDEPFIGMVMRDKFDYLLVKKAVASGCHLSEETTFESLSGLPGDLRVHTNNGVFRARILVGADGVISRTAKALGLQGRKRIIRALEAEVFYDDRAMISQLRHTAHFDLGAIPKGYGWIFPKMDHLSIGVGTTSKRIRSLKHYLNAFMETKGLHSSAEIRALRGHQIPYNPSVRNLFANQNGLLVGDAAGLTDPVTGEGIYYAVLEAIIAGEVIINSLKEGSNYVNEYNRAVRRILKKEMLYARRLSGFFYGLPNCSKSLLKRFGNELVECHLQIVCGKRTYRMLYFKLLNFPRIFVKIIRKFFCPVKMKSSI